MTATTKIKNFRTGSRIPTREDGPIVDHTWDGFEDEDEDDFRDDEDDEDDCGMFPSDGVWFCGQAGSEPCEFCPNRRFLGEPASDDSENNA